ncbi:hypothetical protein M409DRAFT_58772 [Zasmidium cellare ATCC 36951]|uniref:Heterokaryon incompatibility domain-containing protein n=1 Tax=Zasmidium cellare ATCC 36951 TaxID=1080233 RepID=A0A6A6C8Q7_ZASCE|nr:uncharacterized protein M409DRAFT_58772 [Zasmidium cellare ATCC 36951]KAF2162019.1 hypothetical protein M409DRAFT_58772 [Zasmidium cellare ATCC 36951]
MCDYGEEDVEKLLEFTSEPEDRGMIALSMIQRHLLGAEQFTILGPDSYHKIPEQYEYRRLPARSIRLLKVYPYSESSYEPLVVSLHVVPLDTSIPFDALSYTWGPPSWAARNAAATQVFTRVPRCYPVYCGSSLVHVTKNLRDALVQIRFLQSDPQIAEQIKSVYEESLSPYLWIDELCIDQEHAQERGQQVSMMGQIYSKANLVLAWLGNQEPITRYGLEVLQQLETIMQASRSERVTSASFLDERFWRRTGFEPFSTEKWQAVIDILTREWFTRTWIIQEVGLASRPAVGICGSTALPIMAIVRITILLLAAGWCNLISDRIETSYPKDHFKFIQRTLAFHPFQWLRNIQERTAQGDRYSFHLLQAYTFPLTYCFDPRDKVYAATGLATEFTTNGAMTFHIDYDEPPTRTYIRATKHCFEVSKSLDLLSITVHLDRGQFVTDLQDLPFWCPNYSSNDFNDGRTQPLDLQPDDKRMANTFAASGGSSYVPVDATLKSPLLKATGIFHGNVVEVVDSEFSFEWKQLSEHIEFLAHLTPPSPAPLIESFWRTLVHDMYDPDSANQPHPAAEATRDDFFVLLYIMLKGALRKKQHEDPDIRAELERMASSIDRLREVYPDAKLLFPDFAYYLTLHPDLTNSTSFWAIEDAQNPLSRDPVSAPSLVFNIQAKARSRRIFRTSDQRLGMGTKTMQAGDEVWLLAGGRVPYILRPLPNGNYEFHGEATLAKSQAPSSAPSSHLRHHGQDSSLPAEERSRIRKAWTHVKVQGSSANGLAFARLPITTQQLFFSHQSPSTSNKTSPPSLAVTSVPHDSVFNIDDSRDDARINDVGVGTTHLCRTIRSHESYEGHFAITQWSQNRFGTTAS